MFKSSIKSIFILSLLLGICSQAFAIVPTARTVPANRITFTSATLNTIVNAQNLATTIKFEYGLTTSYGDSVILPVQTGFLDSFKKAKITGLIPHRTYHYRVVATNASGTTTGSNMFFITGSMSSGLSGRGGHNIILDSLGLVYTFGINGGGQLGDGTTVRKLKPVKVLKGAYPGTTYLGDNPANPIIAVVAGIDHSLALAADGIVYAWGNNNAGGLGDGTTIDRATPIRVLKRSLYRRNFSWRQSKQPNHFYQCWILWKYGVGGEWKDVWIWI
ncbi:MAG: hypothetical protein IPK03_09785 [Bacteroidetes bacterium]|nr:hypothetical protein [Bacteroidota bacterium]